MDVSRKDPYKKFRIPRYDSLVDPKWCRDKFSVLQIGAHLVKLSVDLVTEDTASVWSQMCGQNIKVKEKLLGIYRTQPEMLCLKRKYEEQMKKAEVSKTASLQGGLIGVSNDNSKDSKTDCFSLNVSKVPLPYILFCIVSEKRTSNNKVFKGLLDTGSQCSILTESTIAESELNDQVKRCEANITLRGATGSQKQPFVGEIGVNIQILNIYDF